ncbi:MAG: hypothetical protein WC810_27730, partial [Janthinobacterium sp.]
MARKIAIALMIFTHMLCGCENKNDKLNAFISERFPTLKDGQILVIPNSGCTTCISEAENSIDSLIRTKNYRVIFTQVQSLKVLKYRLSKLDINLKNANIFVDANNDYIKSS